MFLFVLLLVAYLFRTRAGEKMQVAPAKFVRTYGHHPLVRSASCAEELTMCEMFALIRRCFMSLTGDQL